ncbi:MAG: DUF2490 domain-containing protein [Crocinitomicaceae bacterium]
MTKFLISILLVLSAYSTICQTEDALLWTSAAVDGKINKDFNFELNTQFRFDDNMSRLSSAFFQSAIDYEIGKLLKLAVGYRFSNKRRNENYSLNNRLFSDLNFDYEIFDDFDLEIRLRAQHDFDRFNSINNYIFPSKRSLIRIRYGLEYSMNDWKPSISHELFFNINERSFSRYRLNLALGYKISKRHSVKIGYTFQQKQADMILNEHIYKFGYSYTVKGKLID